MADYTGFVLGVDIVELQELSGSLSFTPTADILLAPVTSPDSFFPNPKAFSSPIYRGLVGGNYVYNVGSPPLGATDVVIIGYKEV